MAKAKKLPSDKKIFGINLFPLALIFVAAASVFVYDRTIWIARAQQEATDSPSAVLTCVNKTNGNVRVVTSVDTCKKEERGVALQSAVSNLLSDVEVVWYQPPGDRNTNFEDGIDVACRRIKVRNLYLSLEV